MPPVYTLTAVQAPAVQVATGVLDPLAAEKYPPVSTKLNFGDPAALLVPAVQELAVRADALSRHGGGGIGVLQGLELSVSGQTLTVSPGAAGIDGLVVLPAAATHSLTAGVRSHIWYSQTGDIVAVTGSLLPPEGLHAYLGSVSGAEVDYSGRVEIRGGLLWRRTADAGAPADTPPATTRFLQRSTGGVYLWTGTEYLLLSGSSDAYTVRVDAEDTPGYLGAKVVAGDGSIVVEETAGPDKTLKVTAPGSAPRSAVTWGPYYLDGLTPGVNYHIELAMPADVAYGDVHYSAVLQLDQAHVEVNPEDTRKTAGRCAWTLCIHPDDAEAGAYGDEYGLEVTVLTDGTGFTGEGSAYATGTLTCHAITADGSLVDLASGVSGVLPVANGGTGASVASAARANLGLGTLAVQSSDAVVITGGSLSGVDVEAKSLSFADAGAARDQLGLGSMAAQDANTVAITGGSVTGISDLAVADGGTGASTAAGARTNLGAAAADHTHEGGSEQSGASVIDLTSGDHTPTIAEYQTAVLRCIGSQSVTRKLVMATSSYAGYRWVVANNCTEGAVQIVGQEAPGIALATLAAGETAVIASSASTAVIDIITPPYSGLNGRITVAELGGYTAHGAGNTPTKTKYLTGTTADAEGGTTSVAHGLTGDQIVGCEVYVRHATNCGTPAGRAGAGRLVHAGWDATYVTVQCDATDSENVLSKPFVAKVTYMEPS